MKKEIFDEIENKLLFILEELENQPEVAKYYPPDMLSYQDSMSFLRELIDLAGEYGIAYESIISALELFPYNVTGKAAVKLLELGLIFQYKTDRPDDRDFDRRKGK